MRQKETPIGDFLKSQLFLWILEFFNAPFSEKKIIIMIACHV